MLRKLSKALGRVLSGCAAAVALVSPAMAGYVSGDLDPAFGPALPGLRWGAHFELYIPNNNCTSLTGTQTLTGDCAGATLQAVFLRLYNTGTTLPGWDTPGAYLSSIPDLAVYSLCDNSVSTDPNYYVRCNVIFGNYFNLTALRIEGGNVVGLQTSISSVFITSILNPGPSSLPTSALANEFSLGLGLTGPTLTCNTCPGGPVQSSTEDLRQFIVTYNGNDASDPKFSDGNGNPLGAVLNARGQVLGLSTSINGNLVPEPAGVALTLTALAAAALAGRRRG